MTPDNPDNGTGGFPVNNKFGSERMNNVSPEMVGAILALVTVTIQVRCRILIGRKMLDRWAKERGYEILSSRYLWFSRGPFSRWSSGLQTVYHVVVRSDDGWTAHGWVQCGTWFWGTLQYQVEDRLMY